MLVKCIWIPLDHKWNTSIKDWGAINSGKMFCRHFFRTGYHFENDIMKYKKKLILGNLIPLISYILPDAVFGSSWWFSVSSSLQMYIYRSSSLSVVQAKSDLFISRKFSWPLLSKYRIISQNTFHCKCFGLVKILIHVN